MQIISLAFEHEQLIPAKYTCDGENVNPSLTFMEVPMEVVSFVLIVDDPDAPGGDWVHWLVWNIDPNLRRIWENSVPETAIQGTTDFGKPGYGGPCPPSGFHNYHFKLYALDTLLDLPMSATKLDLEKAMEGHILDRAVLVGLYQRQV